MELGLAVAAFLAGLISFTIVREFRARRTLAEARVLQNDLQLAIDTIPTIVWSTRPDGSVDFMNRAWQEFTGITAEDAAQRWVETLHPDEATWVQETRNASIVAGKAYELDARLRRSDGTYRWVLRRAVPLRNERGEIVKWYGTGTDIDDLKRAQRAARRARERRFTAALEERTRVAREIHDTLLQGFTGIALQLTAITRRAADAETSAALAEVVGLAQRTLDDARQAIWDLRAPALAGPFPTALREAAETAVRGADLTLDFQMRGIARPLAPQIEATLARVLQESTTNTIKHAGAHALRVRLSYTRRSVRLSLADDGKGFEVDPEFRAYGGHWGLLGMKERAAELGGTLRVHSAPGRGTTVAFRIPISPNGELPA